MRKFVFLILISMAASCFADFVLIAADDSAAYGGTFNNLQNHGSGFGTWFNGVNANMSIVSASPLLSGLNYWQISGNQTLYRNIDDVDSMAEGRLDLLVKHDAFASSTAFSHSSFALTDGGTTPQTLLQVSLFGNDQKKIKVEAGGNTYYSDSFFKELTGQKIDYSLVWDVDSFSLTVTPDGGASKTVTGSFSSSSSISGLAFKTAESGDTLGFDALNVYAIPEPMTLGLIALIGACAFFVRRRFLCLAALLFLSQSEPSYAGSWTNRAGHVLHAEPVSINRNQVKFLRDGNSVVYPLSVFLETEQERLRTALKDLSVPEGLRSAYEFHVRSIQRARIRFENGLCLREAYDANREKSILAFLKQAEPYVKAQKISEQRVQVLVSAF